MYQNSNQVTVFKLEDILETISTSSQHWPFKVSDAKLHPQNGIFLKLDRLDTFKKIITKYTSQNPEYFSTIETVRPVFILAASGRKRDSKNPNLEERNQLRCQMVTHHLRAVCQFMGIKVKHLTMPDEVSPTIYNLTEESVKKNTESFENNSLVALETFVKQLEKDSELSSRKQREEEDVDKSKLSEGTDTNSRQKQQTTSISLNLKDVILDQNLVTGGHGYLSNLGEIEVLTEERSPSRQLIECAKLEFGLKIEREKDIPVMALHISTPSQNHHQQSVELIWRSLSESARNSVPVHITLGPVSVTAVTANSTDVGSIASIIASYESELREASAVKYGDEVQDNEDEIQKRRTLAKAAIKFDILSTALGSTVKIDMSQKDLTAESRPGVFCSVQLCQGEFTLPVYINEHPCLTTGGSGVEQPWGAEIIWFVSGMGKDGSGIYPPFPPVEEVGFSCLRENDEWKLLLHYAMQFPDLVAETLGNIFTITQGSRCNLYPNKVCRFLYSLSRDLSVYYSRTHILVEPRPHLIPIIHARLYLLKTVMRVMEDSLRLLDIEPLHQM
ncbi:putative DALR anticodon-binding domain-containing protein 3 [Apostichopus japonicus]|uniref:Putative DALR anticodon-binding domain-containing protein 3 n=1 Tax=Stichopus japonicus TaxID=307972 RepID=A0A2G8L4U6_STIJA|nr:putative DALR anticodon-binding domain-containing protein 3 [Apostichopus japonicus]